MVFFKGIRQIIDIVDHLDVLVDDFIIYEGDVFFLKVRYFLYFRELQLTVGLSSLFSFGGEHKSGSVLEERIVIFEDSVFENGILQSSIFEPSIINF